MTVVFVAQTVDNCAQIIIKQKSLNCFILYHALFTGSISIEMNHSLIIITNDGTPNRQNEYSGVHLTKSIK